MSRASLVRDAVADAISAALPSATVEKIIYPDHTREELEDGPKIIVGFGRRNFEVSQGPDVREVIINVGVLGMLGASEGEVTRDTIRQQHVTESDAFDDLFESVLALWTPNGTLVNTGMAEHSFIELTQDAAFDTRRLFENGIHFQVFSLTYEDSVDE